MRFYCDGLQKRDELLGRMLQISTAVPNDSCSGNVGGPHDASQSVKLHFGFAVYFDRTYEWWRGANIDMKKGV